MHHFYYNRNTKSLSKENYDKSADYGQKIEPHGEYMNIDPSFKLKAQESGNATVIGMLQDAQEAVIKAQQNKTASFIVNILAALFCLGGALMMWSLKKNGFFVYVIGEFTPTIFSFLIIGIGKGAFGIISSGFLVVIPLVFIILYATQLKHME